MSCFGSVLDVAYLGQDRTWRTIGRSGRHSCERLFYLGHVRTFSGPLIKRKVLVDSDQPKALASRSLEVKVWVRYLELPHEARLENFPFHFFYAVGLDFQPNRSRTSQELALVGDIPIEKHDIEVLCQADEVPFGICFCDFAAKNIAIEFTNAVSILPRDQNRRMVSKNDLCHGLLLSEI